MPSVLLGASAGACIVLSSSMRGQGLLSNMAVVCQSGRDGKGAPVWQVETLAIVPWARRHFVPVVHHFLLHLTPSSGKCEEARQNSLAKEAPQKSKAKNAPLETVPEELHPEPEALEQHPEPEAKEQHQEPVAMEQHPEPEAKEQHPETEAKEYHQ
ncbi:hypothetical protein NDU88_003717 [Pleurodeles waltl]|uniref:Uncharacterized protein n=1 Tax=Pleurodeles waltl TaxID=8319 RepID=A0AAV7W6E2_PLEWA|nr:hypothetical protein NDU88_003717 [Pleurodeles waltl]